MEDSVQEDRIPNGIQVGSKRKTEEQESSDNNRDHSHTKETKQKSKKFKDSNNKKEEELGNHNSELATIEDKKEGKRKRKNRQDSEGHVELSSEEKEIHTEQNIEPKDKKKKKKKKKKSPVENEEGSVISNENGGGELLTEKNKRRHQSSNKEAINDLSEDNASGVVGDTIHSTEKDDQTLLRTVENEVLNRANGHGEQPFAKFQKNATPPAFVRRCSAKTPRTEPRKNNNLKVGNNIFFIRVK